MRTDDGFGENMDDETKNKLSKILDTFNKMTIGDRLDDITKFYVEYTMVNLFSSDTFLDEIIVHHSKDAMDKILQFKRYSEKVKSKLIDKVSGLSEQFIYEKYSKYLEKINKSKE